MTENTTMVSLSVTLLGALLVSTWRFASLASTLTATVSKLEKKAESLDMIPLLMRRLEQVEILQAKHNSVFPKFTTDLRVLEGEFRGIRKAMDRSEMRELARSIPDLGGDNEDE